jgi:asparagine synthase (glutamine-hydrolysing)
MFFSVENRTPLLDSELFSFSLRIPSKLFVRDGYTKDLLRQATAQWSPGEVVRNRRKTGFNAPLEDAIDLQDTGFRKWLWAENILDEYVEPNSVSQLLQKQKLDNHESKFLFNLISTRIFLEEFGSQ